ncbi:MAG: hypothetical protein KF752_08810 [Pirellulaceae bacterium]|nr:hypothetical protein [Pirellulaceae bacterium]
MSDLEKFLQQAAERLKQRVQEQQARQAPVARQVPVRQAERVRAQPNADADELLEAEVVQQPVRKQGGPKQGGPKQGSSKQGGKRKPPVSAGVDQADERMAQHTQQLFGHQVGNIEKQSSPGNAGAAASKGHPSGTANQESQVQRRDVEHNPLVDMLRQPETLKAAFIASEIFKRKF